MQYDLLIKNALLLPSASDTLIQHGFVAVQQGRIALMGSTESLPALLTASQTIDARNCLVMPGLVNAHTHAAMTLFRGLADDLPLMSWLNDHIFPAEANCVSPEMVYWCSKLAAAELIRSGTTTVADGYFFEQEAARAFGEAGIRAVAAQGIIDFPAPGVPDPAQNIASAAHFLASPFDPLITPALFCHSPYTCSPHTLLQAKELAAKNGCKLFIHVAETQHEVSEIKQKYDLSPVRHLHRLGILDPDTVCVHCVWVDPQEIALLQQSGCGVVTCPESNMKLASGVAPVPDLLQASVPLGLGTDGCASNNDLDLFQEMDSLAKLHKVTRLDPTVMPAATALSLATTAGADLLGLGAEIGRLEAGMLADLIIIDLDKPHLTPFYNKDMLVYGANGHDVRDVIIQGRIVMNNREIATFDLDETMSKVRELSSTAMLLGKGR